VLCVALHLPYFRFGVLPRFGTTGYSQPGPKTIPVGNCFCVWRMPDLKGWYFVRLVQEELKRKSDVVRHGNLIFTTLADEVQRIVNRYNKDHPASEFAPDPHALIVNAEHTSTSSYLRVEKTTVPNGVVSWNILIGDGVVKSYGLRGNGEAKVRAITPDAPVTEFTFVIGGQDHTTPKFVEYLLRPLLER
jgi:hypothetical protein